MSEPVEKANTRELRKQRRERIAIFVLTILFVLLTIAEIRLTKLSSTLPFVNSIFFFGLLNINIILLVAIFWLIFRNISKLFLERRRKILGSRLKTKLVFAFVAFAITPTLLLFAISSLYINSSFDKWFSLKVQNTLQASLEITRNYYRNADRNGLHFAQHLASQLGKKLDSKPKPVEPYRNSGWIQEYLDEQRKLLALHAVEFYFDPFEKRILSHDLVAIQNEDTKNPNHYPRLPLDLLDKAFSGEDVPVIQHIGTGDLIRTLVPVKARSGTLAGVLVVSSYVPVSLVNKVDEIASVFDDYREINPLKYPIKTAYFIILVMITLVIIFVAIWLGLYIAREMTVPIERLVRGARQVGGGNLEVQIENTGEDEISALIESFNKMTMDLRENRIQLTNTTRDSENRRLQLETILANIAAGVIVVDKNGEIITFNRAASHLLKISAKESVGIHYQEVLKGQAHSLATLIERAPSSIQFNVKYGDQSKSLAGIATPLYDKKSQWGVVVVVDDISDLIKAQREVAWREVARRIAHEIKNPLTPIKLSAQRLRRRFDQFQGPQREVLEECTDTIVKHTDELKDLVNEFSNFARLPEVSPSPNNLEEAIREVVTLFSQAHPKITFIFEKPENMPIFSFDRDQIKRVVMNLLDNAVAAMNASKEQRSFQVIIRSLYNEKLKLATIEIQDNGPGMSDDVRSRVFEPYFSTKKEGTGLGLAIAKRIINDHNGFIRVESEINKGTQFQIELPTEQPRQSYVDLGLDRDLR